MAIRRKREQDERKAKVEREKQLILEKARYWKLSLPIWVDRF